MAKRLVGAGPVHEGGRARFRAEGCVGGRVLLGWGEPAVRGARGRRWALSRIGMQEKAEGTPPLLRSPDLMDQRLID